MTVYRECVESPLVQGTDEQIVYQLTTTPWGASPSSITVKLYDKTAGTDVSSTCLSGSASAVGDVITTPVVKSLVADHKYRLEIKFTTVGNIMEAYTIIYGQD